MAKKQETDFTGKVQSTIAEATAAPAQEAQEVQEAQEARKERRTYTEKETADYSNDRKTAGRKGMKLPRINLAFSPALYDYIRTMARAAGMSYTDFCNLVLQQHMDAHADEYKQAVKFRNSL